MEAKLLKINESDIEYDSLESLSVDVIGSAACFPKVVTHLIVFAGSKVAMQD